MSPAPGMVAVGAERFWSSIGSSVNSYSCAQLWTIKTYTLKIDSWKGEGEGVVWKGAQGSL